MLIKHLFENNIDDIKSHPYFRKHIAKNLPKYNKELKSQYPNGFEGLSNSNFSTVLGTLIKGRSNILYHGTSSKDFKTGQSIAMHYRDGPRDSNKLIHDTVNELAEEMFNEPIRNLLFTTKIIRNVIDYANLFKDVYIILPDGDYTMYVSDTYEDFYVDYLNDGYTMRYIMEDIINEVDIYTQSKEDGLKKLLISRLVMKSFYRL